MKLYDELADWWPLASPPQDCADDAALFVRVLRHATHGRVTDVLELGSGGGNHASHMKHAFRLTLAEPAPRMLELSRATNPECEHVQGDMRTMRLDRTFDAVFVHDSVMYMTTEADLRAAADTAFAHLRPGGAVLFVPDETAETFEPGTIHVEADDDTRSLRYLEWSHPADGTTYLISFGFLLREGDGPVRMVHDDHLFGLFSRATWIRILTDAGFEAEGIVYDAAGAMREMFIGRRP